MGSDGPRILVAGDFAWTFYEPEFCDGLRKAGATVHEFRALNYFGHGLRRRIQQRLVAGPAILRANAALLGQVWRVRPKFLLAWRTPWLNPSTVRICQRLGTRVVLYNNDDPFGPDADLRIWRRFRRLIPVANKCYAYRSVNLREYLSAGAKEVQLLRSWYNPAVHRHVDLSPQEQQELEADITFVGHAEDDGRVDLLEALAASGRTIRIFGTGWEPLVGPMSPLRRLLPVRRALGDDYAKAMSAARIGIVFLSRRNRDQYTRRCFEIPAIGALMLAPRTDEIASMFRDGAEAVLFSSREELVAKAALYCADESRRRSIAEAGHARCLADRNDVNSRAADFLTSLEACAR